MTRHLEAPVTREAARTWARRGAQAPDAVRELWFDDFNADVETGGFVFVEPGRRLVLVSRTGDWQVTADDDPSSRQAKVEAFHADCRHRHRPLTVRDLGPSQRLALHALLHGRLVRDLPADEARVHSVEERDYAEYLLVWLHALTRHHPAAPGRDARGDRNSDDGDDTDSTSASSATGLTMEHVLRIFAGHDHLMAETADDASLHDCPICGRPTFDASNPTAVCGDCAERARCIHRRLVAGFNTGPSGGFVAHHLADPTSDAATTGARYAEHMGAPTREVCEETTRTGACWIGDVECQIGEAKFGGIRVDVHTPQRPPIQDGSQH